ncbi:hypothetical protein SteCoe_11124 [Stentor coeruleus]|uniref:Guanylate cyclase domain-containing protein n=1 Tax=Stentor coeruleus TaxID=5963 RepID=A0A1R2CE05_9CILI|nr:hypothetical protein SteCoe_11124 [Stentor coeruleus]
MSEGRKNLAQSSAGDSRQGRPSIFEPNATESIALAIELTTAEAKWKTIMFRVIDHWSFTAWMTILTIYALFGDDVRISAFTVSSDTAFNYITTICLFFFMLEIALASLCKKDYWLGFFFWLDLISTISLITDIGWVWDEMTGGGSSTGSSASKASQVARAGRASRAGTRAARIIRIIRVIRLIRIVKLYKMAQDASKDTNNVKLVRGVTNFRGVPMKKIPVSIVPDRNFNPPDSANASMSASFSGSRFDEFFSSPDLQKKGNNSNAENSLDDLNPEAEEIEDPAKSQLHEESKVGKELSELTTRRVIMLVLGVLILVPFFLNTLYTDENTSYEYGLKVLDKFTSNPSEFRMAWDSYINEHSGLKTPLIYLEVLNLGKWYSNTDIADLRDIEKQYVVLPNVDDTYDFYSVAIFDIRYSTKLESELNICKTIFICIILATSSSVLSRDAQILVLDPIESMIAKVKKIAQNPLEAAQEQEKKEVIEETARMAAEEKAAAQAKKLLNKNRRMTHTRIKRNQVKDASQDKDKEKEKVNEKSNKNESKNKKAQENKKEHEEPMETVILETTLNKIGALLALGFGEAGSEIIATNMQKGGGEVDPMIPGKKTHCIFGFCDIRDFADATDVLQQEVLSYVNEVAYIVHKTVDYFCGSANKNIGDAFLLVWKFPDTVLTLSEDSKSYILAKDQFVQQLSDMAVISFLKIIAEIHKNPKILKYRKHEGLNARLPGFSVKMGFGLHQGWAIEGAIGSEFKIDASYLSPNVNMASRLEAATKQFGVHILLSSLLYEICSQTTRSKLRRIDKVTVKGSKQPIELYTCDLFPNLLKPMPESKEKVNMKRVRVMGRMARKKLRERTMKGEYNVYEMWEDDDDLIIMRSAVSKAFLKEFSIALQDYLDGKWTEAKAGFQRAQDLKEGPDGPCQVLLDFINSEGGTAPANWPGYRELHDK